MSEPLGIGPTRALADATDELIGAITASRPVAGFLLAQDRYQADAAARSRLERLAAVQQRIRQHQAAGQVTAEDMSELRTVRAEVETYRVIAEYWQARRLAVASLRGVNESISRLLGVDFAVLAQRQGPC